MVPVRPGAGAPRGHGGNPVQSRNVAGAESRARSPQQPGATLHVTTAPPSSRDAANALLSHSGTICRAPNVGLSCEPREQAERRVSDALRSVGVRQIQARVRLLSLSVHRCCALAEVPRPPLVAEGRPWKNAVAKVGKLIVAQPVFRGGRCIRSARRTCRSGGKRSDGGVRATYPSRFFRAFWRTTRLRGPDATNLGSAVNR